MLDRHAQSAHELAHVLLVEDHADTRTVTQRVLRAHGYRVHAAATAADALRLAKSVRCDLALVDIGLPDMSGSDLLGRLRRVEPVPALALTAFVMSRDVEGYAAPGFDGVVAKPCQLDDLLAAMRRLVPRAAAAGAADAGDGAAGHEPWGPPASRPDHDARVC